MLKFAEDTRLEQISEHHWRGRISADWSIAGVPNGGYIMAIGARALQAALPHPHPLTVTAYYMAPAEPGPVDCEVEVLRTGGSSSHGCVRLLQNRVLKVMMIGVFADLTQTRGESRSVPAGPAIRPYDECVRLRMPFDFSFGHQVLQRVNPGQEQSFTGQPDGRGQLSGWLELADGPSTDPLALLLFADGFPPPVFTFYGPTGWVPTLELTVQVRGLAQPGPIQCHFETNYLTRGVLEEDGYLWDSDGQLVAISRQTAKFRLPK
ncbi:thioesterase family protein [Exilibacterium tricleocarpae]|uniref:Thioesterase family protein n=1 Tax=Exilibacterium tricleocarpae TaxID=2591008 RepID=A0A545SXI4_9GAMM|nr:thioesterase family protein [Exilibacterium tricleocarpae]TQV69674.1 thioesterase family protein [Exilibacterium tricleocarpae]